MDPYERIGAFIVFVILYILIRCLLYDLGIN